MIPETESTSLEFQSPVVTAGSGGLTHATQSE